MATTCPTTAEAAVDAATPGFKFKPVLAVALGFVMAMLDVTVVNVALPQIQADLSVSLTSLVWVVDGYTLTFAALLLIGGALANRYGARAIYMSGLAVFIVASALCGTALSGGALVAARLMQGIGAALFMPSSLSLLVQTYPDDKVRIKVLGLWSAIVSLAVAMGPVVGGLLVGTVGWRSIFWLNLPIGIAGLILTHRYIAPSPKQSGPLSPGGHTLGIITLSALAYALIEGASYGWMSLPIAGAVALAIAAAMALVIRERRNAQPIIPRALLSNATFSAINGTGFLINVGAFGQIFLISLFLPQVRGTDAWHTGIWLLPLMAVIPIGNLLSSRIAARWGVRLPLLWGTGVAGALSASLIVFAVDMPYPLFATAIALSNLSAGIAIPAMTTVLMQAAGQTHANIAAASLNANRQIGTLIGVAAVGAVLHITPDWHQALSVAYVVIAVAYVGAAILVGRYIRPHLQPTS